VTGEKSHLALLDGQAQIPQRLLITVSPANTIKFNQGRGPS
jgi:hypothetical protein